MKFFYSASTMGYGDGYKWHDKYAFPPFPRVTRTMTWDRKRGIPFAILLCGKSVWNRVGLSNVGFFEWLECIINEIFDGSRISDSLSNITVSIAGKDWQIQNMIEHMERLELDINGVELNYSCPNVKSFNNRFIPKTKYPLYLKLNCHQDPVVYDLDNIKGIRLNSVPSKFTGAWSGKKAQFPNWKFIEKHCYQGLNIAGCSITSLENLKLLKNMGCTECGIGSLILTDPHLVELLKYEERKPNERVS